MTFRPTTIERAYQLAESGVCRTVGDVKKQLAAEGFVGIQDQLYGATITAVLRQRCLKFYKAQEPAEG